MVERFSLAFLYPHQLLPSSLPVFPSNLSMLALQSFWCWSPFLCSMAPCFHFVFWDHTLIPMSFPWMGWICAQTPWTDFACTPKGLWLWPCEIHQFHCQLWHGTQRMVVGFTNSIPHEIIDNANSQIQKFVLGTISSNVATLTLGSQPRQKGLARVHAKRKPESQGKEVARVRAKEEAWESHHILLGVWESAKEYEGVNLHIPKAIPTLGNGIPVDSKTFRERFQGWKLNGLWCYLYHWKALGT